MRSLLLILLLAGMVLCGCSPDGSTDQDEKASLFGVEKYQFGDEQDQTDVREERPGYRRYE